MKNYSTLVAAVIGAHAWLPGAHAASPASRMRAHRAGGVAIARERSAAAAAAILSVPRGNRVFDL